MPTLFTYCIPYDDGAAPNPYWGTLTLAICKPKIRRAARVGDWIVGTGSKHSPIGDSSRCVVYAMQVTHKMSMREYDAYAKDNLPGKIPDWTNGDKRRRLGDSIYDFSVAPPRQRKGVHKHKNREKDLTGGFVLLSNHFFYFGDKAVDLPHELLPIVKQGQGHRSKLNMPYVSKFVRWIEGLGYAPNALVGEPQLDLFSDNGSSISCTERGCEDDD